ncbi:hypothetical protein MHU86_2988 [Fragilaria crotonensis]|nr:hypothetical protein MHU86_2988 [Fragilaria crotonensis]
MLDPLESRNSLSSVSAQRWHFLKKNLQTVTKRSSSLTVCEGALLDKLVEDRDELAVDTRDDDAPNSARRNLKQRIADKGDALTIAERKFLTDLADSPNVSADYLIRSARVLFHDPLFNVHEENEIEDVQSKFQVKPSSFRQHDASFRTEVWTHFSPLVASKHTSGRKQEGVDEQEMDRDGPEKYCTSTKRCMPKLFKRRRKHLNATAQAKTGEENDDQVKFYILATSAFDEECKPHVLSPPMMQSLRAGLPVAIQQDNFWLKYSMVRDGASMQGMLHKLRSSTRTVLAIETMEGDVFGAFTSSPWRPLGPGYFGSCEAFLWRMPKSRFTRCETAEDQILLESNLEIYPWSGSNRNIQCIRAASEHLIVGGGAPDNDSSGNGGSGLTIHFDTMRGFSDPCFTFSSPALPTVNKGDSFEIANLEVWALTPVETIQQAEKLEFARQFVFDHAAKRE